MLRTDVGTNGQTDGRTDEHQTDGRSGPTTRPAFAKATQVKMSPFFKWVFSQIYEYLKRENACISVL